MGGVLDLSRTSNAILENVGQVILGKRKVAKLLLSTLLAGGHALLEDVPGTGKTMMARAFAKSMKSSFRRIQFTPDLLPSDIIGVNIYNQKTSEFEFKPGPIFASVVLADEINRASPKVQSSLLECMEEGQITVDGVAHQLPEIFFVLATENPVDQEGTYPLPESQKDRFMVRLRMGYPDRFQEREMIRLHREDHPIRCISSVSTSEEIIGLKKRLREIRLDETVEEYIVELVNSTRESKDLLLGASPRATLALFKMSRAMAALDGRSYVLPDDVKQLAPCVLAHRLVVDPVSRMNGLSAEDIVEDLMGKVSVSLPEG